MAEMNELGHEIAQAAGPDRAPVLGSGHPLADIMLLKHRPQTSEIHEGVAFFGRAGQAVLKSIQRLHVDPMAIYGTNCFKYEDEDEEEADRFLTRELHIVQPKLVVVMGQDALACLNPISFPLAKALEDTAGDDSALTPTVEALVRRTSTPPSTSRRRRRRSGPTSRQSDPGGPSCRRTRRRRTAFSPRLRRLVARRLARRSVAWGRRRLHRRSWLMPATFVAGPARAPLPRGARVPPASSAWRSCSPRPVLLEVAALDPTANSTKFAAVRSLGLVVPEVLRDVGWSCSSPS